jgi:ABC-type uncharacterized transport system substrate-binding protein
LTPLREQRSVPPLRTRTRQIEMRSKKALVLALSIFFGSLAFAAVAQQKVPHIGFLSLLSLDSIEARRTLGAFREGLRERGYVDGQNIVIETRAADGNIERYRSLAAELVSLHVDLILAPNTPAARAAREVTRSIPIVAPVMGDPVGDGLVGSLAKPGGNVTGSTFLGPTLVPKRLELLKEMLPQVTRVAALIHPAALSERATSDMLTETEAQARKLGLELRLVTVEGPNELDRAFSEMARERTEALIVFPSSMLFFERKRLVELTAARRLPSIYGAREFVEIGGLISYGASIDDLLRRSASYVDKILKGAKPADLPVQQPTKFELLVNVKTAKAIGIAIPQSLLLRADEVIQ